MAWLCTMFMQQGSRGWTESWYNPTAGSTNALNLTSSLALVRRIGLGAQSYISALRVSDPLVRGDSAFETFDLNNPASVNELLGPSDMPSAVWYVQAQAGPFVRRQLTMRGMPDAWYRLKEGPVNPDQPGVPGELTRFLKQYIQALQNGGFGLWAPSLQLGDNGTPVIDVGRQAVTNYIQLTCPAGGFPLPNAGDQIRLYTPHLTPKIATLQYVQGQVGGVVTLLDATPGAITYLGGMRLRVRSHQVVGITDLVPLRPSRRKTGRAFFVPRGRPA